MSRWWFQEKTGRNTGKAKYDPMSPFSLLSEAYRRYVHLRKFLPSHMKQYQTCQKYGKRVSLCKTPDMHENKGTHMFLAKPSKKRVSAYITDIQIRGSIIIIGQSHCSSSFDPGFKNGDNFKAVGAIHWMSSVGLQVRHTSAFNIAKTIKRSVWTL